MTSHMISQYSIGIPQGYPKASGIVEQSFYHTEAVLFFPWNIHITLFKLFFCSQLENCCFTNERFEISWVLPSDPLLE